MLKQKWQKLLKAWLTDEAFWVNNNKVFMLLKKSDEANSMTLTFSKDVFERSPEDHHASFLKKRVKSSFALRFKIKVRDCIGEELSKGYE